MRALYSAGAFVGSDGGAWQFNVPNEAHGARCADHRATVEAALSKAVGGAVKIEFVVGQRTIDDDQPAATASARPATASRGARGPAQAPATDAGDVRHDEEQIDLSELVDAPPESVKTPLDRLAEAFPGSEMVSDA